MKELTALYSSPFLAGEKINIELNPANVYELEFLLHTRIFLFEETGGNLKIDFVRQDIIADYMYVVPPLHFHSLNHTNGGNFVCIDIDNRLLTAHYKYLLYAIKYKLQKCLPVLSKAVDDCTFDKLAVLTDDYSDKQRHVPRIVNWIETRTIPTLPARRKNRDYPLIEIADRFLELLANQELDVSVCCVKAIAAQMYCSESTLLRMCKAVFGVSIQQVLQYHLALKAIYLLADYRLSITDVAIELNFSSIAVFTRYMKRITNVTPTEIRACLNRANINTPLVRDTAFAIF